MGARWVRQGRRGPGGEDYRNMSRELQVIVMEEMTAAAQAGEREAKRYISVAGTRRQWNGSFPDLKQGGGRRSAPSRGRINTGEMRDAITYRVVRGATVQARVGWLNEYEDYFGFQDEGFSAGGYRELVSTTIRAVEGMRLMAHMRAFMRDQSDDAMDRIVKRVINGL